MTSNTLTSRAIALAVFSDLAALAVVADQLTKMWAREALADGAVHPFIPGVLDLRLVYNTGAAFSMGEGAQWLFVLIAFAIVSVLAWFVWREHDAPPALIVSLGVIAGGGVGNMIDRVASGKVCDFLATSFIDFPIFNVADICVTCGIVVAFVLFLRWEPTTHAGE